MAAAESRAGHRSPRAAHGTRFNSDAVWSRVRAIRRAYPRSRSGVGADRERTRWHRAIMWPSDSGSRPQPLAEARQVRILGGSGGGRRLPLRDATSFRVCALRSRTTRISRPAAAPQLITATVSRRRRELPPERRSRVERRGVCVRSARRAAGSARAAVAAAAIASRLWVSRGRVGWRGEVATWSHKRLAGRVGWAGGGRVGVYGRAGAVRRVGEGVSVRS